MRQIEAIFFDFDGTLVDTSEAIVRSYNGALDAEGLQPVEAPFVRQRIGRPLREMFADGVPGASGSDLDQLTAAYRSIFQEVARSLCQPFPTVVETVTRLAGHLPLAVVTSRLAEGVFDILDGFELRAFFGAVVDLEDVATPKPDPEPLRLAARRLGVDVTRAMMVGDTPDDVLAARAAGATSVGVTTGSFDADALAAAGAEHVVPRLAGIPALLDLL